MELEFINNGPKSLETLNEVYNKLAQKIFAHLSVSSNYEIDVSIVDNKAIHQINKDYRGIDRPTDVISFAFFDDKEEKAIEGVPSMLGEIIISYEKASEQAKEYGNSLEREMSFLFLHGMLHLLGYDHMNEDDEFEMFRLQDEILGGKLMDKKELVAKAIEARKLSYSPYSKFAVGAAVLTTDGRVFMGANVENSAYPLCMCGERNALYNAYMHGVKREEIAALALAADTDGPCTPCGACRQVMSELMLPSTPVYMANIKGALQETTVAKLLPFAFSGDDLK